MEASQIKDQLADVVSSIAILSKEVQALKSSNVSAWSNVNSNSVPPLPCTDIVDKVQVPGTCNDLNDDLQVSASEGPRNLIVLK